MNTTYRLFRPLAAAAAIGSLIALSLGSAAGAQPGDPLSPPANGPRRAATDWNALVNATVHPRPGETIEHATVVMRDGRIVSVSHRSPGGPDFDGTAPEPPVGATRWDATGLHVYAGLIDAYVEVEAPMPDLTAPGAHWNKRVTPQRSALDGNGVDAKTAKQLRDLGFTAAGVSPKGGVFRGMGAVVSLAEPPAELSSGRPPVYRERAFHTVSFETARGGRDSVERWESYPDSQMGAMALIRQTLSDARWVADARKAGINAVYNAEFKKAGGAVQMMGPTGDQVGSPATALDVLEDVEAPLAFDVDDELEVLRAAKICKEFTIKPRSDKASKQIPWPLIVFGSGLEFRRLDAIAVEKPYLVVPLAFPEPPKVDSIGAADDVSLRDLMTWEQAPTNPRRLDAAGLTVALTTSKATPGGGGRRGGFGDPSTPMPRIARIGQPADTGDGGGGGSGGGRGKFRDNLRTAIRNGLPEDRALAMLTVNPAQILGVSDRLGTIEAGKTANLTVSDGPLFAKKTKVREVWIDGRRHEINAKKTSLEGTWEVTLEPGPAKAGRIRWVVDKDNAVEIIKSVEGEKDIKAKARSVRVDDAAGGQGRVAFVFDHEPFGTAGVFTVSGLLDGDALHGDGTRADGAAFRWTARKVADEPVAQGDEEKEEGVNAKIAKQPKGAKGEDDEEEKPVTDVPEKYGYPFGAYSLERTPAQPDTLIIEHATVWTSGPDWVLRNARLTVKGGKIVSVDGNIPDRLGSHEDGPRVIDATGKHISPGIIDCHSHTGISKGVNESGQAVTAEVRIEDVTNPDAVAWYRELAGGTTTVNNLHGSANPIGGQNCVNKIRWGCVRPDDMHLEGAKPGIKFALGENVKRSNSADPGNRYPTTRMGVEAIIRDRFTAAREYAAGMKSANPPRRDLELEALAQILAGERLIHCHSYRQDEILMLCRLAQEFGFKIGTFQHNLEGYKVADEVGKAAIGASLFSDWWAYKVEVQDAIPGAGPIMHDAGVIVSYNSDSDELARRLNVEAGKASKYGGLSAEESLKFVTINPAKQLMIDNKVGSLEAGKDADFVIWSGPPTSSLSRCEATWIDGREYFSLEKDKELRARDGKERQRIIQKILAEGAKKKGKRGEDKKDDAKGGDTPEKADSPGTPPQNGVAMWDGARSGRGVLLYESLRRAAEMRRDYFLDLYRRGIDPESARCGQCGEMMLNEGGAW